MTVPYLQNLPSFIQGLRPYQAGRPIEEVMEERNIAIDGISKLASNENPLGLSSTVARAIQESLTQLHRYPEMAARRLKDLLADHLDVQDNQLVVGNGSEDLIALLIKLLVRPGDEIISSEKTFIGFYLSAQSYGADLRLCPMTEDFRFDVKALASKVSAKTKLLYLANPNNPTGTYIRKHEFEWLMANIPKSCLVIMDEAYIEFAKHLNDFPDAMDYIRQDPDQYANVISMRTFSKAYGIAGMRVGYAIGPKDLIGYLHRVKLAFSPSSVAQAAACGALLDKEHLHRAIENNITQYMRTFSFLSENGLNPIPSAANFIAFKLPSRDVAFAIYEELLNEGVIIRPLEAFYMPEFLRVSIGTDKEMSHFIRAMETVLPKISNQLSFSL